MRQPFVCHLLPILVDGWGYRNNATDSALSVSTRVRDPNGRRVVRMQRRKRREEFGFEDKILRKPLSSATSSF